MEYGYCQCGCGQKTKIALRNRPNRGWVKGEPKRFIAGHGHTGRASLQEAFWTYVTPGSKNDCWIWQGTKDKSGYGQVNFQYKLWKAHRVSYMIYHGDPGELYVLHRCDNPACVNPNHLAAGTNEDNIRDMIRKGRNQNNRIQPKPKFSADDIRSMRIAYENGEKQIEIAAFHGVHPSYVSRIVRKIWYKNVE